MQRLWIALLLCGLTSGLGAATVTTFGPASWGVSDATLGFTGSYETEDFEDLTLANRLLFSITADNGAYGPSNTLNQLFNPATGDPNGANWSFTTWDGTRSLLNRLDPIPVGYYGPPGFSGYGSVTFTFTGGASKVGFAFSNNEVAASILVNGVSLGALTQGNIAGGAGRNGYFVISADATTPSINTVTISSSVIDAIFYDHLLYQLLPMSNPPTGGEVPEPATWALLATSLGVVWFKRRR